MKYPTDWAYGIPRGSILDRRTNLSLRILNGNKVHNFSYSIGNFESKEECLKFVEKEKIEKSHELGLTRNEIRFINENIIEVKLTKNKTFITDAKHLNIVNKYPLQAKAKREKGITRYYVYAQDKKKTFKFTKLITKYKIVEYINGNTLDLREINMKEFGFGIIVKNEIMHGDGDDDLDTMEDVSKYYFMDIENLPKNKWILGSVDGTIFFRKKNKGKILTMCTKSFDGNNHSKSFKVSDYGSINKTKLAAKKYMINCAHYSGYVRNKIRILDNYMEVMLDEENIMKTDLIFLPLFIPLKDLHINVLVTTVRYSEKLIYAKAYIRPTAIVINFHKFIMGDSMIDHMNGDTLDNRLINLRFTNYSHNNSNRKSNSDTNITGVTCGEDKGMEYYRARLKYDNVEYGKYFYINKYGSDAKKFATKFRRNILELNTIKEDISDLPLNKSDIPTINASIQRTKDYLEDMENRICYNIDNYLPGITNEIISEEYKKSIHRYYLTIQAFRIEFMRARITKLTNILYNLKPKKNIIEI